MKRIDTVAAALVLIAWSGASHAYLDPGTGSMLLQGLLAGIAGAAVVLRLYWYRVKTFWSNLLARKAHDETQAQAPKQQAGKAES